MIELHDLTRLPYDGNGNSRHVVHFPTFLTKEENNSNFLLWAGLAYDLALMRAAPVGGSKYRAKSFGGGIKFTAQECEMQDRAERAFASFENSKVFKDSRLIKKAVEDSTERQEHVKKVLTNVAESKLLAGYGFAEALRECEIAAKTVEGRHKWHSIWLAAVHLSMELYEEVKCK